MQREVSAFGVLFVFGVFGRKLQIRKNVDVFGDLEYLGNGYKKRGCLCVWGYGVRKKEIKKYIK